MYAEFVALARSRHQAIKAGNVRACSFSHLNVVLWAELDFAASRLVHAFEDRFLARREVNNDCARRLHCLRTHTQSRTFQLCRQVRTWTIPVTRLSFEECCTAASAHTIDSLPQHHI